jgi:hypothetical protein
MSYRRLAWRLWVAIISRLCPMRSMRMRFRRKEKPDGVPE